MLVPLVRLAPVLLVLALLVPVLSARPAPASASAAARTQSEAATVAHCALPILRVEA